MKRIILAALALLVTASAALSLSQSAIPPKFPLVWGSSAGTSYIRSIPQNSQIGIQNCAASLTDGFPPLTFVPSSAGGCPPFGQDMNGILKQVTQWNQWQQAGGPVFYDSAFAASIGGYPKGAMLSSAVTPGTMWMSTADNNSNDPDAGGANWVQAPGQIPVGTPVPSFQSTALPGYVIADSGTIGNGSSNATGRANADTQFLFAFLWANCSAAVCPIFTSAGGASTRGATPAADFAANKALATPLMQGASLIAVDSGGTTFLSGAPVTSGSRTATASIVGENLHSLTSAENGPHTHPITDQQHTHTISSGSGLYTVSLAGGNTGFVPNTGPNSTRTVAFPDVTNSPSFTGITGTNSSGSGAGHNTVDRSFTVKWNLKL